MKTRKYTEFCWRNNGTAYKQGGSICKTETSDIAIFRWMQVAELIGWVLDCRVMLAAPEWQKHQGIRKVNYIPSEYKQCDRLTEGAVKSLTLSNFTQLELQPLTLR